MFHLASQVSDKEREHILKVKEFVNSEAYRDYLMPLIMKVVSQELPKPGTDRWQERYTYHYALTEAMTLLVNTLTNLSTKDEFLKRADKFIHAIDEN